MNRRQFILLAQAIGLSAYFGEIAFSQAATVRVRKSATSAAAQTDIETLRRGVSLMKSNPQATEYASWMYWANSHGTDATIPPEMATVWGQCKHKTLHFLTWHRAYLVFFEALIRELTQTEDFALPYWDWYSNKEFPPAYAVATLENGAANPLYHPLRTFKPRTLLMDAFSKTTFGYFQSSLESNPHGSVHVMTGGEMGVVITAGRDPIFVAHHANVDRLWQVWLAMDPMHRNNTTSTFLNQSFAFDVAGQKRLRVGDMLNIESLGYQYDSLTPLGPSAMRLAAVAQRDTVPPRPGNVIRVPERPGAPRREIVLNGESHVLMVGVPADVRALRLQDGAENSPRIHLVIDNLTVTPVGSRVGFEYRVYVNLPGTPRPQDRHGNYYVDAFNSFQLVKTGHHAHHGGHGAQGETLTFDVTEHFARLQANGTWQGDQIEISLVSDDTAEKRPLVKFENMRIVVSQ